MRRSLVSILLLLSVCPLACVACTFFSYAGDDLVLFGNSEDYFYDNTVARFVPATEDDYGCLFVGFGNGSAQGGMNTAGLAFDAASIDGSPMNDHPELPFPDPMNFCEIVLRKCATIDEVVELIRSYNLSYVQSAQFLFTDRTGASVIVAPGPDFEIAFVYPDAPFQVATNINTAIYPVLHKSCERHRLATTVLERIAAGESDLSIDTFVEILDSVSIPSGSSETIYSNVFDLTHGIAYLYYRHDFDNAAILDINDLAEDGIAVFHLIADLLTLTTPPVDPGSSL